MSFDLELVRKRLPDRQIDWFATIGSTMIEAGRQPIPGRIVGAEEQTAGMGRHGRRWHSPANQGLYISVVLQLGIAASSLPAVMLALGIATRAAIARTTNLSPDIRWPNDILINGRKCAGILAQLEDDAIIAGIGINVAQSEFPEELDTPATSLFLECANTSRENLLVQLAHAVDEYCEMLKLNGIDAIASLFAKHSSFVAGRRVRAEANGRIIEGVTNGLDSSGFLIVREDTGMDTTILGGGVRPV